MAENVNLKSCETTDGGGFKRTTLSPVYLESDKFHWRFYVNYRIRKSQKFERFEMRWIKDEQTARAWSESCRVFLETNGKAHWNEFVSQLSAGSSSASACETKGSGDAFATEVEDISCNSFPMDCLTSTSLEMHDEQDVDTSFETISTDSTVAAEPVANTNSKLMKPLRIMSPVERVRSKIRNMKRDIRLYQAKAEHFGGIYRRLMQSVLSNKTHELILKHPLFSDDKHDSVQVDTHLDEKVENEASDFSVKQLERVNTQCVYVGNIARLFCFKFNLIVGILSSTIESTSAANPSRTNVKFLERVLRECTISLQAVQQKNTVGCIVDSLLNELNCGSDAPLFSAKTIKVWYNQFLANGCKGFCEDMRGSHERDFFLEEHNLLEQFKLFMSTSKQLTVDTCRLFVNALIKNSVSGDIDEVLAKFKVKYPVSRKTVHRWMLKSGAKYEPHSQSYYTDRHDAPDTITDRNERYLVDCEVLSRREASWVSVPLQSASEASLLHAAKVMCLSGISELPTRTHDGVAYVKVHVDYLSDSEHVTFRMNMLATQQRPGEYLYSTPNGCPPVTDSFVCKYKHSVETCKCLLPCIRVGQDEAVFKQNSMSKMCWTIDNKQPLRPKNEGPGVMVSGVQDEYRGFGFSMTDDEVKTTNVALRRDGHLAMKVSPGIVMLDIGSGRDGYWNAAKMAVQVQQFVYAFETAYEDRQLVFEVDQSSGHTARKIDGLCTSDLNLGWGGAQRQMRDSLITDGCLGESDTIAPHKRLQIGQTQCMTFREGDDPPYLTPEAPPFDRPMNAVERAACDKRKMAAKKRKEKKGETQSDNAVAERGVVTAHSDTIADSSYTVIGYVGKQKGIAQILWERGLYLRGMWKEITEADRREQTAKGLPPLDEGLNASRVLMACRDFADEKGILQEILEARGHILLISPKCHPELAGLGVEYTWGLMKRAYRQFNDCVYKNLHANVSKAMSTDHVHMKNVLKFSRRTRDYCRTYRDLAMNSEISKSSMSYALIEKMLKTQKTHRSILDLEGKFLNSVSLSETDAMVEE